MSSAHTPTQHTVTASEFKAKCLKLMDEVEKTGQPLIITKRGKHMVRLMPCKDSLKEPPRPIYGCMKGTITIHGDLLEPLEETGWERYE